MAAAEIEHHERLAGRLLELGVDVAEAMTPFVAALDAFHDGTRASTWLEGLVNAYVGDSLAADFYREVAAFLPQPDRSLVEEVLAGTGHSEFALRELRAAIAADPTIAGRLALWARRLVGEALTQSQAVIADHEELADLIIAGVGDLTGVGELLARITTAHSERMRALGLNSCHRDPDGSHRGAHRDPPDRTAARSRPRRPLSRCASSVGRPPAPATDEDSSSRDRVLEPVCCPQVHDRAPPRCGDALSRGVLAQPAMKPTRRWSASAIST